MFSPFALCEAALKLAVRVTTTGWSLKAIHQHELVVEVLIPVESGERFTESV
jgi:hypothetical protein